MKNVEIQNLSMKPKVITAKEAISKIKDNSTLCVGGAGAGHAVPDKLLETLGNYYCENKSPKNLTIIHPCGIGDNNQRGLNHIAHEGLINIDIGGFWGNAPKMIQLAKAEKIKGYNFPQGVLSHLIRATAGGEDGVLTKTGLYTFVDPRNEGGKINKRTKESLVSLVNIHGQEYLYYKTHPINVAFIRGTSLDCEGNLTMEEEVGTFSMLSMAQAARSNNGIVIAQVKKVNKGHAIPAQVKVPGVLIDYAVLEPEQTMTFITNHEPTLVQRNTNHNQEKLLIEGAKRVIARRAALELKDRDFVNLGYGIPDGVPIVAQQEDILSKITFLIEQGQIGGILTTGLNFGAMYNPSAILDDAYQFDFFHGGGLDICFLGFAQIDEVGNVNSSKFGEKLTGCGGFIDISQHTKKVVFCGGFAAKSELEFIEGQLKIIHPGKLKKFVKSVEQITFNSQYALDKGQEIIIVTERAVFNVTNEGLQLIEIAPGLDLDNDILNVMDFRPAISPDLKLMDSSIFWDGPLNLNEKISPNTL